MTDSSIISVHFTRRKAREREREVQKALQLRALGGIEHADTADLDRVLDGVPTWALGAKVEKAGRFQWAVVATRTVGR